MSTGEAGVLDELTELWPRVSRILSPLYSTFDYERSRSLLESILDRTEGDETHPLAPLADNLGTLIEDYENTDLPAPMGDPVLALQYLMQEHHIDAGDLSEVGSPSDVQEILHRERQLTGAQITALSARFHVSPAVFVPMEAAGVQNSSRNREP